MTRTIIKDGTVVSLDPDVGELDEADVLIEDGEIVETWAVRDGDVICGSGLFDVPDQRDDVEGRIMHRTDGGAYETVGRVDANVSRIEVVES